MTRGSEFRPKLGSRGLTAWATTDGLGVIDSLADDRFADESVDRCAGLQTLLIMTSELRVDKRGHWGCGRLAWKEHLLRQRRLNRQIRSFRQQRKVDEK